MEMEIENKNEMKEIAVTPDIRVQEHPKSKKFRKIYYIAFVILFIIGFIAGSGSYYSNGGTVMNRFSEHYGESFPAHDNEYTGWYFLRFTYKSEGWQHNYLYDMGYSDYQTLWGDQEETYPENIAIFIILNGLLAAAPFIFEFIRKKECKNTELNITEDRIYGSSGIVLAKKKIDIPFKSINNITITNSKTDKLKSGKTLEVLYGNKKAKFRYIHNAEDVKDYINQCVTAFKNKKEDPKSATIIKNDSTADELKKFKDLLDSGAITQEEFDAKKKQILGL